MDDNYETDENANIEIIQLCYFKNASFFIKFCQLRHT